MPSPLPPFRTLNDLPLGRRARIQRHLAQGAVRQRLVDLGLLPNVEVVVVRSAPLGDPIQIKIGSSHVTLRRAEASLVEVIADGC